MDPGRAPSAGALLFFHGNAGNIGDRALHAGLLSAAGFDVLLFDYRGYGRSSGRAGEAGTYRDARAALGELLRQPGVDPARVFYFGESLGGAIALQLAVSLPPAGLILQSTFTSIRDLARMHYRVVPNFAVPDAYPSLRCIPRCARRCSSCTANETSLSRSCTAKRCSRPRRRRSGWRSSRTPGTMISCRRAAAGYGQLIAGWANGVRGGD